MHLTHSRLLLNVFVIVLAPEDNFMKNNCSVENVGNEKISRPYGRAIDW